MDTVFALASAPGKAGVSVVRVSGPDAFTVCERLTGRVPEARRAAFLELRGADGAFLDHAVVLVFEAPASFTGENIVEFQIHGSKAVLNSVLSEIAVLERCRPAEPGEFTRRALQNGKMNLTQVEGLADLIEAETELQRRQAHVVHSGQFGEFVEALRKDLISAVALLEACIDFADEEIPDDTIDHVTTTVDGVLGALKTQIEGYRASERIRHGFEVAIVGRPNVGKSTLLNALVGRQAAITSKYAGTTRDIIEVRMDLSGLPVTFLDTAGLRDTDDPVEHIGIGLALDRAEKADVRVYLQEEDETPDLELRPGDLVLKAKADSGSSDNSGISGLTGAGIDGLLKYLENTLGDRVLSAGLATRERHKTMFQSACACLERGRGLVESGSDAYDIASEDLRSAIRELEAVVGRVDVENYLDYIFSSFCVGK